MGIFWTVELVITPEIKASILRKIMQRKKTREFGAELHSTESGEIDLGEIGDAE